MLAMTHQIALQYQNRMTELSGLKTNIVFIVRLLLFVVQVCVLWLESKYSVDVNRVARRVGFLT